jgi:hypothetical protein
MGDRTRFWKNCRVCFRLCRIGILLLILLAVCALVWLERIGLPDFVKQPIIQALHQDGIELQFVRLRFSLYYREFVADNVRVGGETNMPSLSAQQVRLQLDYGALLHRKLQLDGLVLRQGKLTFPVSTSNEPPVVLTIDGIQTELRFETNDTWSLDNFQADFAGARFVLAGTLAHPEAVPNWKIFQNKQAVAGAGQAQFKKIARALGQIHFNRISQLQLHVNGDANNVSSLSVHLGVNAPDVDTPWGGASNVVLVVHTVGPVQDSGAASSTPRQVDWAVRLSQLASDQLSADSISGTGFWRSPTELGWNARVTRLKTKKLNADFAACAGFWQDPVLGVTNLYVRLGGGELRAGVQWNTSTRVFSFTASSCFDLNAIADLLTEKTRERLAQFSLPQPPNLRASGSFVLPGWPNRTPDWRTEIQPTVRLDGELSVTNFGVDRLTFEKVHTLFSYSNEIWTLPDVVITRPEGQVAITGTENDANQDYLWHVFGWLSPNCIEPYLTPKALRGFQNFKFTEPLYLDTQIYGRLYDYDSISATGHAQLKNFSIRGEAVDNVESDFHYARRVAEFFRPHLEAGPAAMHADGILLDYPGDRIYFTNGFGSADPEMVATAIGPLQAKIMQPYHFPRLPTARVNGYAPLRNATNADLDFQIVGSTPFECLKVNAPKVGGEIHWIGSRLILTNMSGSLYDGTGGGNAVFDFKPHNGCNYSFAASFDKLDLHLLASDLDSPTNRLEGRLSGSCVVTSAYSGDWRTVNGYGHANVHDGLLWDVPVFGIFSPVLDGISPGMGDSRATDASAQFIITNGVIATDNLQIHTAMVRIRYDGTVDLQGHLNAHATGQLLRDVPGVGVIMSTVFWPFSKVFECRVTGTTKHPDYRLVIVPQPVNYMLHPLRTLEDLSAPPAQLNQ